MARRAGNQDDGSSSEDAGTLSDLSADADKTEEMDRPVWQLLNEQEAENPITILIEVQAPDGSAAMLKVPVDRGFPAFYEQVRTLLDIPQDVEVSMRYSHSLMWEDSRTLEEDQDLGEALNTLPEGQVLRIELWEGSCVDEGHLVPDVSFSA